MPGAQDSATWMSARPSRPSCSSATPSRACASRNARSPSNRSGCGLYREYLGQYHLTDRVFPWSPRQLEYVLEDIGLQAGLAKHLSFDMCRWTCAVRDRQAGMDPDRLREKLGLSRIQWREIGRKIEKLALPPL